MKKQTNEHNTASSPAFEGEDFSFQEWEQQRFSGVTFRGCDFSEALLPELPGKGAEA